MKYTHYPILALFILLIFTGAHLHAEPLLRYTNKDYSYSIMYPDAWEKREYNLHYKHVLLVTRGLYTYMKISATKATAKEKLKWDTWRSWYTQGTGRWSRKIIEAKTHDITKGISGKLIVIEYATARNRMLQRTLVTYYKNFILVIECKSPIKTFYHYQPLFDAVMASVKIAE